MGKDPNRLHNDAWFSSSNPVEYEAFFAKMRQRFPEKSEEEVVRVIFDCRRLVYPAEGRGMLFECVERQLDRATHRPRLRRRG